MVSAGGFDRSFDWRLWRTTNGWPGTIRLQGDFYLFGQLGAKEASPDDTQLECIGMAYVAQTGVSTGTLMAKRLQLYEGADLRGPFKTLKLSGALPVLHDVQPKQPLKAPGSRS